MPLLTSTLKTTTLIPGLGQHFSGFGTGFGDPLWDTAGAVPSLDQYFSADKSLRDRISGQSLITFTRASSGTYVDSDGVIRTATTNYALRSEEFDNGAWLKAGLTASANAGTGPFGASTADLLTETATTREHLIYRTGFTIPTATFSCYVKSNGRDFIGLRFFTATNNWVRATFSLTGLGAAGAVVTGSASEYSNASASIASVGGGWYRVSLAATRSAGVSYAVIDFATSATPSIGAGAGSQSYTGDGTSGIYALGAQVEAGVTTPGEYIPTTSAVNSAPRFTHDPVTLRSLGLLVEEQRTNYIRNNTMVGAVAGTPGTLPTNWAVSGLGTLTRQVVGIGTLNGISYIDLRFSGTSSSTQIVIRLDGTTAIAAANGQTWTFSLWSSLVGGSLENISQVGSNSNNFNSGVSYIGGVSFSNLNTTATLTRRSAPATITEPTAASIQPQIFINMTSGAAIDITLRIGLPQLEQGAFATSVIPTTGTQATRNADVATITGAGFSSWYRQDEGTVLIQWAMPAYPNANGARVFQFDNNVGTDRIWLRAQGGINRLYEIASGSVVQAQLSAGNYAAGQAYRSAIASKSNDFAFSENAGITTDQTGTAPSAINGLGIGSSSTGGSQGNLTISRLTYWPQRLPNAKLQAITTP